MGWLLMRALLRDFIDIAAACLYAVAMIALAHVIAGVTP